MEGDRFKHRLAVWAVPPVGFMRGLPHNPGPRGGLSWPCASRLRIGKGGGKGLGGAWRLADKRWQSVLNKVTKRNKLCC